MNKKKDNLGIILSCITGAAFMVAMLVRALLPRMILPNIDLLTVLLLSLTALVADCYLSKTKNRDFRLIPVYGALIFGLFPLVTGFISPVNALITALIGAAVLTAMTLIFDTMTERLSDTSAAKLAPVMCALGLYLAAQCLMGIV